MLCTVSKCSAARVAAVEHVTSSHLVVLVHCWHAWGGRVRVHMEHLWGTELERQVAHRIVTRNDGLHSCILGLEQVALESHRRLFWLLAGDSEELHL